MLFVSLLNLKPGVTPAQAFERRVTWKSPKGIKPVQEYWLMGAPSVITIDEADSIAPIMASTLPWADLFDVTVVPAITAEEGLKLAAQMMPKGS